MNSPLFNKTILEYYKKNKREFPWRYDENSYHILVSEIMLQQTQVGRVVSKYKSFLERFPTIQKLSASLLGDVLTAWQGLGYNRRAKQLWETADIIIEKYEGVIPKDINNLVKLPGIGLATAGAVITYSYNTPTIFVETNIRTVFLYFFFKNKEIVTDKAIEEKIKLTIDKKNPREWYYAVVDYGVYLKKQHKFKNVQSKHYAIQSKFHGSTRELRGKIIKRLIENKRMTKKEIIRELHSNTKIIEKILEQLTGENLIEKNNNTYSIFSKKN